jgi:hypothetical protein
MEQLEVHAPTYVPTITINIVLKVLEASLLASLKLDEPGVSLEDILLNVLVRYDEMR